MKKFELIHVSNGSKTLRSQKTAPMFTNRNASAAAKKAGTKFGKQATGKTLHTIVVLREVGSKKGTCHKFKVGYKLEKANIGADWAKRTMKSGKTDKIGMYHTKNVPKPCDPITGKPVAIKNAPASKRRRSSPKRASPKRASPRRSSPKRRSPKRASPKRRRSTPKRK